jgi:hypothetical protein
MIDPETLTGRFVERRVASEDVVPTSDPTAAQALARARARFRRAQQTAVKMKLPVVGDPLLLAKTIVQVEGMGRRLSIRYYVEEVEHSLEPGGYRCTLRLVSDGHGGHSTESRAAVGLSLLEAAGAGSGSGRSDDVVDALRDAAQLADAEGDAERAASIRRALASYSRLGNASREQVSRQLASIAADPQSSAEVRGAMATIRGLLAQRGDEASSGGRVNRQEAEEGADDELAQFEAIDPETLQPVTRYRQTPGRGGSVDS